MLWPNVLLPVLALAISAAILVISELLSKEARRSEVASTEEPRTTFEKRL